MMPRYRRRLTPAAAGSCLDLESVTGSTEDRQDGDLGTFLGFLADMQKSEATESPQSILSSVSRDSEAAMDPERILESERLHMEQIRELDMEELQIEEVDDTSDEDDDDNSFLARHTDGQEVEYTGFTFNICLASLHTYLGEVDDTHGRVSFLDGGAVLSLPMLYLEGVVLFPEATLPLKVIDPRFKAAVERALHQVDAPYTVGVIRVHRNSDDQRVRFATVGTTAEIRQYRRLADGSLNVVARGQQRFRLIRSWMDVERAPCAEVQIIMEDAPLRTPKDAVTQLAAVSDTKGCNYPRGCASEFSPSKACKKKYNENDWECMSGASFSSDYSDMDVKLCSSATACSCKCERIQECSSSDEEFAHIIGQRRRKPCPCRLSGLYQNCQCRNLPESRLGLDSVEESSAEKISNAAKYGVIHSSSRVPRASMSFWPLWVYQMYDSYSLARKAAGLWRQIIGSPNLDDYITKPGVLSFHIGSKLPVSESTRQELLEIDGITYRLRREIQLLECFNHIRCKGCLALIAKRSDMLVMSSDGPLNAYVNPYGYVHEVITVHNATGLALIGAPVKEHSWFPGYAWTMTNCAVCEKNMGWLFTATKKNLLPKSFWGVRCSQVVDDTQVVQ